MRRPRRAASCDQAPSVPRRKTKIIPFCESRPVALIGVPGVGPFGELVAGSLENSNVDLTQQLVNMITAQRNFQANAQMITTQDQITQTVINIR